MPRLTWSETSLPGVRAVRRQPIEDARGRFVRLFCAEELAAAGWRQPVAQINLSHSARAGTVRGLHWQCEPHAEMKLVSCLRGAVFDLALDLRPDSPTYLRWHAETLSAANQTALLIPPGCAHGFQALEDGSELLYCHSAAHAPDAERGLDALDPQLAIPWPLPATDLSARDRAWPALRTWLGKASP